VSFFFVRSVCVQKKQQIKKKTSNKRQSNKRQFCLLGQSMQAPKNHVETQLRRSAQRGNCELLQVLLPQLLHGSTSQLEAKGTLRAAFRLAIWNDWLPVVLILIKASPWLITEHEHFPKYNALRQAMHAPCSPDICAALVFHKADMNIQKGGYWREPLLYAAIKSGQVATVRWLLDAKADMHKAPLLRAVQSAGLNCAEATLVRRMPSRQLARWKRSTRKQRTAIVALLLHAKANPNDSNYAKNTPLRRAIANNDLHIARLLVRAKADVNEDVNEVVNEVQGKTTLLQTVVNYCHCKGAMLQVLRSGGARY
jgi:hypothetical protein